MLSSYSRSRHLGFVSVTDLWNAINLVVLSVDFVVFEFSYLHVNALRMAALSDHGKEGCAALAPRLPWFALPCYSQRCRLARTIAWICVPHQ